MVLTRDVLAEINNAVSALSCKYEIFQKIIKEVGESIVEHTEARLRHYETEMKNLREENQKLKTLVDPKTYQLDRRRNNI